MSLTAIELIEELEGLSPADLEREIEEQQERLARMQRLLSLIKGGRPRKAKTRSEQPAAAGDVDKSVPIQTRVHAFLTANGPAKFQRIMQACGVSPRQLSDVLNNTPGFVAGDGNVWSAK